jgi:hypothetical protein
MCVCSSLRSIFIGRRQIRMIRAQQIILFSWHAHHLRSTSCLQSNCLLLFCFLSSSFLKVTGSQRSKVKPYICVHVSGSQFQFLVTLTFVRPNILDSFIIKVLENPSYKFVAPIQLASSLVCSSCSLNDSWFEMYPSGQLWAAYCTW